MSDAPEQIFATALDHFRSGRLIEAAKILKRLHKRHPKAADAPHLLGVVLLQMEKPNEAAKYLKKAAKIIPGSPEILTLLGCALRSSGKEKAGLKTLEKAVKAGPVHADAHYNFARALAGNGQWAEAASHYEAAIAADPGLSDAYYNLGLARRKLGRLEDAVAAFEVALGHGPDQADTLSSLGAALSDMGRPGEAARRLEHAVAIDPGSADAWANLGNAYKDLGRVGEAVEHLEKAVALRPGDAAMHSNLIFCKNYSPDFGPQDILAEARRWDQRHGGNRKDWPKHAPKHARDPGSDRRLRIGYVSADFRRHPVGYFFEPILEAHDRNAVEVFCYAAGRTADEVSERMKGHADHWRDIADLDDRAAAALIGGDKIDILVDLAGHSAANRLTLFGRQPAPVQATGGGMFGTSGLAAMDYILTDRFESPESPGGSDEDYSETPARLADGCFCYQPPEYAAGVAPPPFRDNGFITYGCFNNLAKISRDAVALWARVLEGTPESRLMLKTGALKSAAARRYFTELFAAAGLNPERLVLKPGVAHQELLKAYSGIDVALDPLPYSGGLTTLEALWQGVPVVSMAGSTFAGRHSASHLGNAGLGELVAATADEYVEIAVNLANDQERLETLRASLRGILAKSPILDAGRHARGLEAAYREMWRRWCEKRQ
ncbi:MAG TPA: tetratricopeptide repeat protein [Alphaproteobacteria bacterium]|nr:tetratricopeptide repeat protein [Alphaproteobacteria bacterium]